MSHKWCIIKSSN